MVYLKSVENVIPLGKLIGLLFLFCLPLLSILFLKTKRNDLTHPVMGTIFLVIGECGSTLYVGLSRIVRNLIQKSTLSIFVSLRDVQGYRLN